MVIVETVPRPGNRRKASFLFHSIEESVPVPSLQKVEMEIDVLKAQMGSRGDFVDLPGDVAADHRNAFLRKCDPVPSHVTLIVDHGTYKSLP